jgi:general secretion pathway protein G
MRALAALILAWAPLLATAGFPQEVLIAKARADIRGMETALTMFRLDNGQFPTTAQGLNALVSRPSTAPYWRPGGYLNHLVKDPWGNDYQYAMPGSHGKQYDLYSPGPMGNSTSVVGNWNVGG